MEKLYNLFSRFTWRPIGNSLLGISPPSSFSAILQTLSPLFPLLPPCSGSHLLAQFSPWMLHSFSHPLVRNLFVGHCAGKCCCTTKNVATGGPPFALTRKRPQRQEDERLRSDFLETVKLGDATDNVVTNRMVIGRRVMAILSAAWASGRDWHGGEIFNCVGRRILDMHSWAWTTGCFQIYPRSTLFLWFQNLNLNTWPSQKEYRLANSVCFASLFRLYSIDNLYMFLKVALNLSDTSHQYNQFPNIHIVKVSRIYIRCSQAYV